MKQKSLLIGMALSFSGSLFAQNAILFKNANIIDGTGKSGVKEDLLIESGSIQDIGKNLPSKDATVVNLNGKSIIPMLNSGHVHVGLLKGTKNSGDNYTRDNIVNQITKCQNYGVNNILVMGSDRPFLYTSGILDSSKAGTLSGVTYYSAGYGFGVPGGAPPKEMGMDQVYRPSDPSQIAAEMDSLQKVNPFVVKMWVDDFGGKYKKMDPSIYKEIIVQAHKRGLKVAAHVYYLSDLKQLLADGLDIVGHSIRDTIIDDATIQYMKEHHVVYIPTLSLDEFAYIYARKPEWINDAFFKASLEPGVYEMITDPAYQEKIKNSPTHERDVKAFETALKNVKRLYDAGVFIVLGTDSGAMPLRAQGFSEHLELELLTQAGIPAVDAIKIGTFNVASLLNIADKTGTIEKGKSADFIIVDGNPAKNIKDTRKIEAIYKKGKLVSNGPLSK